MAEVVLTNLSKEFKGARGEPVRAVANLDLTVADGEFIVLVGPSGCGKSTTLRMIAGLEEVSEGQVAIGGRDVTQAHPKDRDIAMVFQNYALYPHMTVFENMAFGLKLRKVPKQEIQSRVQTVATTLGLEACLERRPAALSGGQQQRVALGRAIVHEPKVFLFDEPLSNLDAKMRVQMRAEISRLHRRLGATMIYVTHDQVEAMTMGDRIVVMNDGVIDHVAPPSEIYSHPRSRFVAEFIGSPPMNFLDGTIRSHEGQPCFETSLMAEGTVTLKLPERFEAPLKELVERKVVLGVRPEHVHALDANDNPGIGGALVPAIVDVVEPMGAETFLYLVTGTQSLVARVTGNTTIRVGDQVSLGADLNHAHFFDVESGLALT